MRKLYMPAVITLFCLTCAFKIAPSLTGKWTLHPVGEATVTMDFRDDGSYHVIASSGQETLSGNYKQSDDTLAFMDKGCGNTWGKYLITFYGNDSLLLKTISDSCTGRMQGVEGVTAKRLP